MMIAEQVRGVKGLSNFSHFLLHPYALSEEGEWRRPAPQVLSVSFLFISWSKFSSDCAYFSLLSCATVCIGFLGRGLTEADNALCSDFYKYFTCNKKSDQSVEDLIAAIKNYHAEQGGGGGGAAR